MTTSITTGGAVRRGTVPTPRPAADDSADAARPAPAKPEPRYPWVEPWGSYRGARPRSEYWDVASASWRSRGPYPKA